MPKPAPEPLVVELPDALVSLQAEPQFDALLAWMKLNVPDLDTSKLKGEIDRQKAILASPTSSPIDRKDAERCLNALAKGLPALATGLRDAIKGFSGGDPFTGSAAIMDICGALASTLGAMSAAGGPPGAVVGAFFSIVSMILKMFAPPARSLSSQLEQIIRDVKSEEKLEDLLAAQSAIRSYLETLTDPRVTVPWTLAEIEQKLNPGEGATITAIRRARVWLNEPKNQDLRLWGPVLAAQCQAYAAMMQAAMIAITRLDLGGAGAAAGAARVALMDQRADSAAKLLASFAGNDPDQLAFVKGIMAAARRRGTVWHVGTTLRGSRDEGQPFVADSPAAPWKNLGGDSRMLAVAATRTRQPAEAPYLAVLSLERHPDTLMPAPEHAWRYSKHLRAYGLFGKWPLDRHSGWKELAALHGAHDIVATPAGKDGETFVYAATGAAIARYVLGGESAGAGDDLRLDPTFAMDGTFTPRPHNTIATSITSVCAVSRPRPAVSQDYAVLADVEAVVYGGCDSRCLKAWFSAGTDGPAVQGSFPAPRDAMFGMAADTRYIWVFTRDFIACATHASVKRCCSKAAAAVEWCYYDIPKQDLGGNVFDRNHLGRGPWDGLQDLTACDDGTLLAVFMDPPGTVSGWPAIYQAVPSVNLAARTVDIRGVKKDNFGRDVPTTGWEQAYKGEANRVYKQPIFCWPLVEGLAETLARSVEARGAR